MKNARQFALIAILLTFAVNFLVACDPKTRSGGGSTANGGGSPAPQSGGTSDSGGCNGVENRCFDSYIVDPMTLPAYKNIVGPLLSNIQSSNPENPANFQFFFKMKPWYIAPVDLATLQKDALGVSFVKSDVQQIAIQNMKAIWIDKRIFDQMSEKDQADLLVHEMVMGLYFIRFVPIKELCEASALIVENKEKSKCEVPESFEKAFAPEKPRPLNDEDNERIRFVTAWLLQNAKEPIRDVDFVRVLNFKKFDRRLFNPDNYGSEKEKQAELKIEKKELFDAIKAAELTGLMPEVCQSVDGSVSKSCSISFRETEMNYYAVMVPALEIQVEMDGKVIGTMKGILGKDLTLSTNRGGDQEMRYSFALSEMKDKFLVGNQINMAILIFRNHGNGTQKQLVFESLVLRKAVLTSIDLKRDPICKTMPTSSKIPFETGFLVHQKKSNDLLVEQMLLGVEPYALCSKDNVEQ